MRKINLSREHYKSNSQFLNTVILNHRKGFFTANDIQKIVKDIDLPEINTAILKLVRKELVVRIDKKYYTKTLFRRRIMSQRTPSR